tara:strand:+ start:200 stop:1096 length:897 start_codon:yes stop_codon:yes gene_type:complete
MFLNSIKNKIKIFFRNINHAYKLINNKEIPKVDLLKSNKSIIVPKNYNKSFSLTALDCNLVLSSNSSRVNKSRLEEFNNILTPLNHMNILYFSHKERDNYMNSSWRNHEILNIYNNSTFQQSKADIFRYTFLYEHGGFWLDFKSSMLFNPSDLLSEKNEVVLLLSPRIIEKEKQTNIDSEILRILKNRYITNWFIGSSHQSEFLEIVINNICEKSINYSGKNFENPKNAILEFTGPLNLTESFIEFILKDQKNINNVSFVDEENHKLVFTTEYSRNFSILDNVTKFHYSRLKNSKILE